MAVAVLTGVVKSLFGQGWKAVSVAMFVTSLSLGVYVHFLKSKLVPQETAVQIAAIEQRHAKVSTGVQETVDKSVKTTMRLNHVLEKHKDWSDQPVPDDVVAGLCAKIDCGEARPTRKVHTPRSKS